MNLVNYLGAYYINFNNQRPPFDNVNVRKAFSLVIDRNFIVNQITRSGQRAAGAFVPFGMSDIEPSSDFRVVGGDYISIDEADYADNVAEAKRLMALAGYPEGRGFPVVEYLYNTMDSHRAIAEALQYMWRTHLGVNVSLGNQEWAVFLDTRRRGDYMISRDGWVADLSDPITFLDLFVTGVPSNNAQYSNEDVDDLIARVKSTAVQAERIRLMHEVERIILSRDMAIAPLYFNTNSYMMNPRVQGAFYTPLGYYFFFNVKLDG
jgi:oligopeptide transport system substrate-binding protein